MLKNSHFPKFSLLLLGVMHDFVLGDISTHGGVLHGYLKRGVFAGGSEGGSSPCAGGIRKFYKVIPDKILNLHGKFCKIFKYCPWILGHCLTFIKIKLKIRHKGVSSVVKPRNLSENFKNKGQSF